MNFETHRFDATRGASRVLCVSGVGTQQFPVSKSEDSFTAFILSSSRFRTPIHCQVDITNYNSFSLFDIFFLLRENLKEILGDGIYMFALWAKEF
jgi:hypothetical protein